MEAAAGWLYRRLGSRYFRAYLLFEAAAALLLCVAGFAVLTMYERMSVGEFASVAAFGCACAALAVAFDAARTKRQARSLIAWLGREPGADPVQAWREAIALPLEYVTRSWWQPLLLLAVPPAIFTTWWLDLPASSALILFSAMTVAVASSIVMHFFGSEAAMRPVVQELAPLLPDGFSSAGAGVPLKVKLLGALTLINVNTSVLVAGVPTAGKASLSDLGVVVGIAVLVSLTLSLQLTHLVTRSVVAPLRELVAASGRVKQGDLSARVPVASGDELGELATGFNDMVTGLEERERLSNAFGSYVDPDVAELVLAEGATLEGEDMEVTVFFVDICEFTSRAERSTARETVAFLNEYFGLIVPLLREHGGFVNKFIGDALLGVFGAPVGLADHATRAATAACAIADAVEERYGDELSIGIGIDSGRVSAGTVGGGGRLEFTVIGDAVNVAARVERATREIGDPILATQSTRALVDDSVVSFEPRGQVRLRGVSDPVRVYAVSPARPAAHPPGRAVPGTVG